MATHGASKAPRVGVVMGSKSDWETLRHASEILDALGIPHESRVVSAHRTPDRLFRYAREAEGRGLDVIIAGAGGAAHLPGMLARLDDPAGPRRAGREQGPPRGRLAALDRPDAARDSRSGRSPSAPAGAANAALLAAAILARHDPAIREALASFRQKQTEGVDESPT